MVKRLVDFALDQRVVTLALVGLLVVMGLYAYKQLPIEAFPDPDDPHVQVITLWPGQAAEDIETQVTRPIEQQLNSTAKLTSLRSTSMFGLSVVTMTFEDDTNDDTARGQVLERMQNVTLPTGAAWQMGANTTSTGEVFRYVITAPPSYKLEDLRALQDWVLEPAIRQVPGVGDVNAFGGGIKQYQVFVKPEALLQYGITLQQVFQALQNNNSNTGGDILKTGEQSLVVRGVNALTGIPDITAVAITNYNGHPVYVGDVAEVSTGMAPRQGIVAWYERQETDKSGTVIKPVRQVDDIVEAIILNRKGTNALNVVKDVKARVAQLNDPAQHLLPPGVHLATTYDRTDLVNETMHTVLRNLIEGGILILVISLVFTSNFRAALVIWLVIPLALSAFIVLQYRGVAANLLSFGAVDFGILVDAAVVIVEAVLVQKMLAPRESDFRELVRHTSTGLGRPMLFSKLILITALVPIFTFQRVEGRIFRPMALTIAGAIVGATIITFTLVPLASAVLLKWGKPAGDNLVTRVLKDAYGRVLKVALVYKALTIGLAFSLLAGSIVLGYYLGTEFLPKLDEGNIWLTVTMPLSVSPEKGKDTERRIRDILKSFPESKVIYSQLGRPDDGTDPKGWNNIEIAVYLPPHDQWVTKDAKGNVVNKDGLKKLMNDKLQQIPGCDFNFSQVIEDNVEEALSGVKGELAIKLFGDDLKVLEEKGNEIEKVMSQIRGVADLDIQQLSGQPNLTIKVDRAAIARYGLDGQTVLSLVETGLGGKTAGSLVEGQKRFDVSVRLVPSAREAINRIEGLWVDTPTGQRIPLAKLATVRSEEGASKIERDQNSRRIAIKCGITDRDMGSFVEEAQKKVHDAVEVHLPEGYHITWEGQFENQQRANARLKIIVPASLLLVLGLLFFAFGRIRYALLILANVPFAIIGGIALLYFTHTHLSVSASIGFIALAGVSVQMGMVLVSQFNQLRVKGVALHEAVIEGSKARMRPVLMTSLMAAIGMLPAATSHGIGSEVQRPLALVILGGMITAVLLTLIVLPALYEFWEFHFPAEVTVPEGLVE